MEPKEETSSVVLSSLERTPDAERAGGSSPTLIPAGSDVKRRPGPPPPCTSVRTLPPLVPRYLLRPGPVAAGEQLQDGAGGAVLTDCGHDRLAPSLCAVP